jgi:GxxExxY protein
MMEKHGMHGVIDISRPENKISGIVIDKAFYVHKKFGPGLLESAYEEALIYLLEKEGLTVERQKVIPIKIDDLVISSGFRADIIVENSLICEIKSIEKMAPIHEAQLLTYLRLSNIKTGLLINFGERFFKDGLKRMVV